MFTPAFGKEKRKLKIFIMSGQSNTVGHARAHTIATLYNTNNAKDKMLRELVFKNNSKVSAKALKAQIELAKKIDQLTGGIGNSKIKNIKDPAEKARVEAEVKKLLSKFEAYKNEIKNSCAVSVSISATKRSDVISWSSLFT